MKKNNTDYIVLEAYMYDENGNVLKKVDGEGYKAANIQGESLTVGDVIKNAYGIEYTYNLANQLENR